MTQKRAMNNIPLPFPVKLLNEGGVSIAWFYYWSPVWKALIPRVLIREGIRGYVKNIDQR